MIRVFPRKTKKCIKCKQKKQRDEFYKDKSKKDGLNIYCIMCSKEFSKHYRENNKEKRREAERKYCENNPDKRRKLGLSYIERLGDGYVREKIRQKYKFPKDLISDDMIKWERDLMQINRILRKEKQNGRIKKIK